MNSWTDGWTERWMETQMEGWTDRQIDRLTHTTTKDIRTHKQTQTEDSWTDGWTKSLIVCQTDRHTYNERQTDRWTNIFTDIWTVVQLEKQTDRPMVRQSDRWTVRQTDRWIKVGLSNSIFLAVPLRLIFGHSLIREAGGNRSRKSFVLFRNKLWQMHPLQFSRQGKFYKFFTTVIKNYNCN